ncbi:hypothetical protein QN277_006825 [Acacia crassicarpa]|uniref:Exonuclease domain-containing protein n=1 Tax=Acacia crassicarpa TaxID=499986 RepID=A0AAE1IU61_9FABA|nr:hypothetical protein QN277_006825 [Acacia crassicarpa]
MDHQSEDRPEIVFFDVETIYSTSVIVEFGAILVCPYTLTELRHYSKLVRPDNPSLIPPVFERRNGITRHALADALTFADIADTVYDFLHQRTWAGHNILGFDCIHIRKAFSELNRPPPEPKAIIDSLPLLTETFGKRAGDMKMASLARYFGLGHQTHRSLDDVRMNLEVVKRCATIVFLESSFSNEVRVNGKSLLLRGSSSSSADMKMKSISQVASHQYKEEQRPTFTLSSSSADAANNLVQQQFFGFPPQMCSSKGHESIMESSPDTKTESMVTCCSNTFVVLKAHEIFISSLTASFVSSPYHGGQRIQLLHNGSPFQISCADLKIGFGIDKKFYNNSRKPKLSFLVYSSQSLCEVLGDCDAMSLSLFLQSGGSSDWKPLVTRKDDDFNSPTVRLRIAISECGDAAVFETKVFKKESSTGIVQKLRFNKGDTKELSSLCSPGNLVDAIFSLDQYEYQRRAGLRLVAKKLIFHK